MERRRTHGTTSAKRPPTRAKAPVLRGQMTERRQAILDAALDAFAERGFKGASVREIARAVGVNEATLYHYFPSKAAVLDALIDQLMERREELYEVADDSGQSLGEVLNSLIVRTMEIMKDEQERKFLRLLMIEGPRLAVMGRYPFLRVFHESGEKLTHVFEKLVASGRMRRTNPRVVALQFLAPLMIFGFHQHGLGGRQVEPINVAEFTRAQVEMFVRALTP
ncbi:MAG: TetR/AcrR family transcriptional regulator [Deltaproteobacteria bacterium]|nr:TetR/AcrR family transcriptional regulator [Deltaproteobacteria bacterium]